MNQRIKTIIVDDEPLACRRVRRLLQADENVDVVAICTNGQEAVNAIEEHHPDLLFLDVQMPGMDGFEVLQSIDLARPPQKSTLRPLPAETLCLVFHSRYSSAVTPDESNIADSLRL